MRAGSISSSSSSRGQHIKASESVGLLFADEHRHSGHRGRIPTSTMAAAETNLKSDRTLRTFASDDDLLSNDTDDERPSVSHNQTNVSNTREDNKQQQQQLLHKSLWDCKAIRWPPHSPVSVAKAGLAYVQDPYLILEVLVLAAFLLACYLSPDYLIERHHRPIPYQTTDAGDTLIDLTFSNPYHPKETIPGSLLNLLTVVFPMSVFWVLGSFFGPRGDMHAALCTFILAMAMKIFVVACIKNYAGYLRPSFYNMCQFNPDTLLCDDDTTSARESFPSGHAATAMSSMTLLALFLLGKVRGGTRQRGVSASVAAVSESTGFGLNVDDIIWAPSLVIKPLALLAVTPMFLGMFIASSRVRDNWHHPADVVCGGLIGIACAMFAHGLWLPSVYSHYAGIPVATVKRIMIQQKARAKIATASRRDLEESDL